MESIVRSEKSEIMVGNNGGDDIAVSDNMDDNNIIIDNKSIKGKNGKKKNYQKMSKFKKMIKSNDFLDFFTSRTRQIFIKLRQAFIRALILYHYNLECYILIEINVLGYLMGKILSQLILDNLSQ